MLKKHQFFQAKLSETNYCGLGNQPVAKTTKFLTLQTKIGFLINVIPGQRIFRSDGFVYLKVDDEYIHTLLPMLGVMEKGYKKPPYFRSSEATGAHISVFYEEENILPDEIGQIFHFTPNQIVIVKASPKAHFIVMQVSSPELEALRKKYGLKPKLFGHEYPISLGKKTVKPKHD